MAKKLYEESSVSDIAVAIREKNGSTEKYKVAEMGAAVRAIPVNDTFWTQENRDSLATILENVPIVADNADSAASINAIRNSFISALRGAATTTHSITYDSTVDGAQTVTFTPMPTEVNDGTSTTITMAANAPIASYYAHATGIAINEVRKSSVKVGTAITAGTGTLTIPNQKADATVTAAPTLLFNSTNQAYTDGNVYEPSYSGYVATCVSGLYELKAGKHYIYADGGSGKKFRVVFVRADYTVMGGSAEQTSGTVIKLGGANSDIAVPADAKYFFLRYAGIDKDPSVVQTALANAHMLLECE